MRTLTLSALFCAFLLGVFSSPASARSATQAVAEVEEVGNAYLAEVQKSQPDNDKLMALCIKLTELQLWGFKAMRDPEAAGLQSEKDVEKVVHVINTAGYLSVGFAVGMFHDSNIAKDYAADFKKVDVDLDDMGGQMIKAGMILVTQ